MPNTLENVFPVVSGSKGQYLALNLDTKVKHTTKTVVGNILQGTEFPDILIEMEFRN